MENKQKEFKPKLNNDTLMSIEGLDYYGEYVKSDNNKYILTWLDGEIGGTIRGSRDKGKGILIFFEDEKCKYYIKLERPVKGKIAENGNIVICDWLFSKPYDPKNYTMLGGKCIAVNKDGDILINHEVKANLANCAISKDGNIAVFHTATHPKHEDGDKLFFFDLIKKELIDTKDTEGERGINLMSLLEKL